MDLRMPFGQRSCPNTLNLPITLCLKCAPLLLIAFLFLIHFDQRGLFLLADWTVLAPVGGITIYEEFDLSLHPMRLRVDAKVGVRIMEYLWPARKQRKRLNGTRSDLIIPG